jgi:general nucleoside transport system permease protein
MARVALSPRRDGGSISVGSMTVFEPFVPKAAPFVAPAMAVIGALAITALLLLALGVNPLFAYKSMVLGAVGTTQSLSDTIAKTVPITLIALGVALTFRCGLWNVGGEGQFYAGAIGAALTGILVDAPPLILIPLEVLAGITAGGLVALVPATLKAKFNTNEILVTLMLNFVPHLFALYLIAGPFAHDLAAKTVDIHASGELPWLIIGNLRLHVGILFVFAAVIGMHFLIGRTTFGFKVRAIGANIDAARAVGINVVRTQFASFLIAGGLGGLSGMIQVAALHHNLLEGMSPGFGFTSVVAALLGRLHPWGILLGSFGFAALLVGGDSMQRTARIESSTVFVIEGLILMFLLAGHVIGRERKQIA